MNIRWIVLSLLGVFLATVSVSGQDGKNLAYEVSEELLPPDSLIQKFQSDIALIKTAYPEIKDIHKYYDWIPGTITIWFSDTASLKYQNNQLPEFDSLNNALGIVEIIELNSLKEIQLIFSKEYNPIFLIPLYNDISGVRPSLVDSGYNFSGTNISYKNEIYTFEQGWGDCPAGCIYAHFWDFKVEGGAVTLLDSYGSPLSTSPYPTSAKSKLVSGPNITSSENKWRVTINKSHGENFKSFLINGVLYQQINR